MKMNFCAVSVCGALVEAFGVVCMCVCVCVCVKISNVKIIDVIIINVKISNV